jgi:hypothetical protein
MPDPIRTKLHLLVEQLEELSAIAVLEKYPDQSVAILNHARDVIKHSALTILSKHHTNKQ